MWSGDPIRFLAVLVVATSCPLLIGIPVAIIGARSLAAKRSIIIRDPAVLERIDRCRTIVLDKTGTLTYGEPTLQSAVGGMVVSVVGMFIAFGGWLPSVDGAVFQEAIDLAAVLNALRAAVSGGELSDYGGRRLQRRSSVRPTSDDSRPQNQPRSTRCRWGPDHFHPARRC